MTFSYPPKIIITHFNLSNISLDCLLVVGAFSFLVLALHTNAIGVEHTHNAAVFETFATSVAELLGEEFIH